MNQRRLSYALAATAALVATAFQPGVAQTAQSLNPQSAAPLAASALTAVPALVPFSGIMTEPDGKPVAVETAITFLIFKDQEGSEPLFAETQAVTPDARGHFKVQLGATLANGLPTDLFSTGEARWLEVQAAGQTPQPRVLVASVPYALKAADSLGPGTRVVSIPCFARFDRQPQSYRDEVLPRSCRKRVAIEATVPSTWAAYVGLDGATIGINRFGLSAPGSEVMKELGITADNVVATAKRLT